jgi:hypothetical protein
MALLKLSLKATQRTFASQFVEEIFRPVVKKYSPFDHTHPMHIHIGDPLEDMGEVADLITKVGGVMTNSEKRSKLDLPEPEDEEIADSYLEPAQQEKQEAQGGGDGPLGGGGGLFNSGRSLAVPDAAVSISDRSEAPDDASVITGDRGGLYYVPAGEDKDTDTNTAAARQEIKEIAESGATGDELTGQLETSVKDQTGANTVNLSGLDDEDAVEVSDTLATLGAAGETEGLNEITTDTDDLGDRSPLANYSPFEQKVTIDPDQLSEAELEEAGQMGAYAGDNIDHLISHEIGHHNHFRKEVDGESAGMQAQAQEIPEAAVPEFAESVSVYAVENPNEMVAELYAMQVRGESLDTGMQNAYETFNGPDVDV